MKTIKIPQKRAVIVLFVSVVVFFAAAFLAISSVDPAQRQGFSFLSGMPYALAKALMGVSLLKLIDELMLPEINTMQTLNTDAKAYSNYMLGYAIIIALAIATA